jgi:hypothetical protein
MKVSQGRAFDHKQALLGGNPKFYFFWNKVSLLSKTNRQKYMLVS